MQNFAKQLPGLITSFANLLPDYVWEVMAYGLLIIYPVTVLFIILLIVLENRDPTKTITWILVLVLLPFIGIILYLFFGRNFRKIRALSKKARSDLEQIENLRGLHFIDLKNKNYYNDPLIKSKSDIITLLVNNSKAYLTEHNELSILHNGSEAFPVIKQELEAAKDHIHFAFYIIEDDGIGNEIKEILMKKAREGVEVRLIYDGVGSWTLSNRYINDLRRSGVSIHPFRPVNFPFLTSKVNYRNHRKIIVVDGQIGFLGGINISDKYLYGDKHLGFWRDTHLKLAGDAVSSLQTVFLTDWYFVSGVYLKDQRYFPPHDIKEQKLVQIVASGPDSEWASIMQAYFAAITTARNHIYITTPYFTPNRSILTALKTAALSGKDVRMLLPSKSDAPMLFWNSMSYVQELLQAGVRVYLYKKGFNHSKVLTVDSVFSSIGSANMDIRSFDQNLEVNALIYNEEASKQMEEKFFEDLEESVELDLATFYQRAFHRKLRESIARVFSPLL